MSSFSVRAIAASLHKSGMPNKFLLLRDRTEFAENKCCTNFAETLILRVHCAGKVGALAYPKLTFHAVAIEGLTKPEVIFGNHVQRGFRK